MASENKKRKAKTAIFTTAEINVTKRLSELHTLPSGRETKIRFWIFINLIRPILRHFYSAHDNIHTKSQKIEI